MMVIKRINIPEENRKIINKKITLRLMSFIFLTVLNIIIIITLGDVILRGVPEKYIAFKYSCYMIFIFLPVVITKVYLVFTDFSYVGKIKKIDIVSVADSKSSVKPTREMLYRKNEVYLVIETQTAKTINKKVSEYPAKSMESFEKYKVGDNVLHLHGTDVTVVLPSVADTQCCCAMCGWSNDVSNAICTHCELPLIKSIV